MPWSLSCSQPAPRPPEGEHRILWPPPSAPTPHNVTYHANGATGTVPIEGSTHLTGDTVTVLGNTNLLKDGYAFAGWTTSTTGPGSSYTTGATFAMGDTDVTLNAVWMPTSLSLSVDSSRGGITITQNQTKPIGDLEIPTGVTTIGSTAFASCDGLRKITIPPSVTTIESVAFANCTGLETVILSEGLTTIGPAAFASCEKLETITIPTSVISIGDTAFVSCYKLTTINIPASVTSIGTAAFIDCKKLESITVDPSNTHYKAIDGVLFSKDGTTLIECPRYRTATNGTYDIPSGVTTISAWAFEGCSFSTVTIPQGVASIGRGAFSGCKLTSVTIPASVTSIGEVAFIACASLTGITVETSNPNYKSVDGVLFNKMGTTLIAYPICRTATTYIIPYGVTSIQDSAFVNCDTLEAVTIPESVTSIGEMAFTGCTSLLNVTFPSSVTSIGDGAFFGCVMLGSDSAWPVTIPAVIPPALGSEAFEGCDYGLVIHVPSGSVGAYQNATGWSDYTIQ